MTKQVGGSHYKKKKIQPWDIIDEYNLNFYEGNVLKYLLREKVDRIEDLSKAIHYLEKEICNEKENLQQSELSICKQNETDKRLLKEGSVKEDWTAPL